MAAAARLGVLGGTFDPVHRAHLALARLFYEELALDRVLWVPAGDPWQKAQVQAAPADRLAMLEAALADAQRRGDPTAAVIDQRELHRHGPSYTIDTLLELRREQGPHAVLVLLLGADQLERLNTWHRWLELFDVAHLAVCTRTSAARAPHALPPEVADQVAARDIPAAQLPDALSAPSGGVVQIARDLGPTSSSLVRDRIRQENLAGLDDLLPSPVIDYIRTHRLYRH